MVQDKQLFFNPTRYFEQLIADIDAARSEIILEVYIFELDQTGNRVLSALRNAAERGIKLRLLIDGVGSYRDANQIADALKAEHGEVRVFHPLPWDFLAYRRALKATRWYSQALYFIASINRRNHRKLCIIDHRVAWLGSYNITADHGNIRSESAQDYWHDTALRLGGPLVALLESNFDQVWQRKTDRIGERSRRFLARHEISKRRQRRLQLLQVLEESSERIWITNAYFNPSNPLLKLLKQKARKGVSVQVIVPSRSDIIFFPALSRSFYADLLQANIRVFEYGERVLHSKTMLIDNQLLVGSTNLNYRSLFHDLELDVLIDDLELVEQMQQRFSDDIRDSNEITLRKWQDHPWLLRLAGWTSRFLRYWL